MNTSKYFYTGVGNRDTPVEKLKLIEHIANVLSDIGYTLRSGAAIGADSAFEKGSNKSDIFLPWPGFNGRTQGFSEISADAITIAKRACPHFEKLKRGAQLLHTRNVYQVLGYELNSPSDFVMCYTRDGAENIEDISNSTGGTATAIRLACMNNIPVFNLYHEDAVDRLCQFLCNKLMSRPRVFNKYKMNKDQEGIYIGRGSPYGNPYIIDNDNTRDMVCDNFELHTLQDMDVEPLRWKNLICYCKPHRCHGDSIFKKLYGLKSLTHPIGWSRKHSLGYEVSSVGDKHYSALYARFKDGSTIEEKYQLDIKGYRALGNDWRLGKGKPPLVKITEDELYKQYKDLWVKYFEENPLLLIRLRYLSVGRVLTDCFASGIINQARALYDILK